MKKAKSNIKTNIGLVQRGLFKNTRFWFGTDDNFNVKFKKVNNLVLAKITH